MPAPIINQLPEAPNPNDRTTFNSKAFTWSSALPSWTTQTNALGSWMNTTASQVATNTSQVAANTNISSNALTAIINNPSSISSSTSSVSYGLGSKTFVVPSDKVYAIGQFVMIVDTINVANYMIAQVTSYSSGNLVVNSIESAGTGSNNNWTISITGKPNAISVGSAIAGASSKTTPVSADSFGIIDSEAGNALKKITFANLNTWIGASYVPKAGGGTTGNFGVRTASPSYNFHLISNATPGAPLSSGSSTDPGVMSRQQLGNVAIDSGLYVDGQVWIQTRTMSNYSVNMSLRLNPNGGQVEFSTPFGYYTGVGGTVTQTVSRTTAVSLSKPSGEIALFSAAGSTAWVSFTVNNTFVNTTDRIIVNQKSGANKYAIFVTNVANGSFELTFSAVVGTATESPVFGFNILRGANA